MTAPCTCAPQWGVTIHDVGCHEWMPMRRSGYESGPHGWNDGRLGMAYDALSAVLEARGEDTRCHPLLAEIEQLNEVRS